MLLTSKFINIKLLALLNESQLNNDLIQLLREEGVFELTVCNSLKEAKSLIESGTNDVVLVDLKIIDSDYSDIRTFHSLTLSLTAPKFLSTSFIILIAGDQTENKTELEELEFRSLAFNAGAQDVFDKRDIKKKFRGLIRCIEDSNARIKHVVKVLERYRLEGDACIDPRTVSMVNVQSLLKPLDDFLEKYRSSTN
jgi:hypothetical protein